jgi:hypothetical protein
MYMQFSNKHKPKIDPMNMDFDFMIKNHPEFFTKLSSQNFNHPPSPTPRRPPPASGGLSRLPPGYTGYSNPQTLPGGYSGLADSGQPDFARRGGGRQVGCPGATLKPKIYPPTLMRNAKPKGRRNNFFK